jgi:RNA polymerase sigma factor (sigma-70 family)
MVAAREGLPVSERVTTPSSAHSGAQPWEQVVTRLVAERGASLQRYAYLLCGNADDAADLVQDALVKTFGRLRNGFTVSSAEAYVRKAVLNTYLDGGRRRTLWRRIAHLTAQPEEQPSSAPTSDERLDLLARVRGLAPRERACIVLRYYEDLKVDDVAAELEISPGAVKRYLSDALRKLAISLDESGADGRSSERRGGDRGH